MRVCLSVALLLAGCGDDRGASAPRSEAEPSRSSVADVELSEMPLALAAGETVGWALRGTHREGEPEASEVVRIGDRGGTRTVGSVPVTDQLLAVEGGAVVAYVGCDDDACDRRAHYVAYFSDGGGTEVVQVGPSLAGAPEEGDAPALLGLGDGVAESVWVLSWRGEVVEYAVGSGEVGRAVAVPPTSIARLCPFDGGLRALVTADGPSAGDDDASTDRDEPIAFRVLVLGDDGWETVPGGDLTSDTSHTGCGDSSLWVGDVDDPGWSWAPEDSWQHRPAFVGPGEWYATSPDGEIFVVDVDGRVTEVGAGGADTATLFEFGAFDEPITPATLPWLRADRSHGVAVACLVPNAPVAPDPPDRSVHCQLRSLA